MHSLAIAEWLLARFTRQCLAASIVGDLFEASGQKGTVWFWLSVGAVLFSLARRRFIAFAAALCLGIPAVDFLHGLIAAYQPRHEWKLLLDFLCLASILLSFGIPYTAIRFGLKDPFTQQIIAAWGLVSIVRYYWWIPLVAVACTVLGASGLVYAAISVRRRRALVAFFVALGLSIAVSVLFSSYLTERLASSHQLVFHQLAFFAFSLGWVIQPAIYARVHGIFFGDKARLGAKQTAV